AVAIQLRRWHVANSVRWFVRTVPAAVVLTLVAVIVQPPVSQAAGVPAKADPVLFSRAQAHPEQAFSVIVRESDPRSPTAEGLVRSLGGHVTHELSIVGGFSATVPGSAVSALTSSPLVWRVWGDARVRMASTNMGSYDQV